MNSKKLKRILSVALSLSMALSSNMTGFAAELTVPGGGAAAVAEDMAAAEDSQQSDDAVAEDSRQSDDAAVEEDSQQTDESLEGMAEDSAQELSGAKLADDAEAGILPFTDGENAGTGDAGTGNTEGSGTVTPAPAAAIVVCDNPDASDANQKATLSEAITAATAQGAAVTIRLEKDAELTGTVPNLTGVTIEANGHTITIPEGSEVTLADATINNTVPEVRAILNVRGKLTIQGGTYTTKGVCVLSTRGETIIQKSETGSIPAFTATVDPNGNNGYYFNKAVIEVGGISGKLTMESGKIKADTLDGTGKEGMYGVYLFDGSEVELGTAEDAARPTGANSDVIIESGCPAVSMNGLHAPGRITIHSGTYTSVLGEDGAATGDTHAKFNSVIYLPASATVEIDGGVFEQKGTKNSSVISIPYNTVGKTPDISSVRVNLNITGGTFKVPTNSQGVTNKVFRLGTDVFEFGNDGKNKSKVNITVSGGTFSTNISTELNNKGISEGFEVYDKGNGSFGVDATSVATVGNTKYSSFSAAVKAATEAASGTKLTLNQDVTLTENLTIKGIEIATSGKMITIPEGVELTLENVTVKNDEGATYVSPGHWEDDGKNHTIFHADGTLKIVGGTYETKGVHMIRVSGTATIGGNAKLSCTAGESEYTATNAGNYDGAPLISVTGKRGDLTITEAAISANVGKQGTSDTDGMYGIYVNHGAKLTLGNAVQAAADETAAATPSIEAKFAAIGMNGTTAPGSIEINSGSYKSHVACTTEDTDINKNLTKFNSVLYLPATANVTINGGTFEALGENAPSYVISIPYAAVQKVDVKLNLIINGGTFKANAQAATKGIFFDAGMTSEGQKPSRNRISIRGGEFNCNPNGSDDFDNYVAGCHEVTSEPENNPTIWKVGGEQAGAHTLTWVAKKDATCWEEGVVGHYECLKCHKMYTTKTAQDETPAEKLAIPKEEHGAEYEEVTAKDATCTEDGTHGYVQCKKCGMCYEKLTDLEQDEKGIGETPGHFAIKAVGHKYQTKPETAGSGQTPEQVPDAEFAGWEKFDEAVKAGEDASEAAKKYLKATRRCSVCQDVLEAASVTVEQNGNENLSGPCDQTRTVTYTVKATFTKNEYGKTIANVKDYVIITCAHKVSLEAGEHKYTVEGDTLAEGEKPSLIFDWSNFSSADYVEGTANGVTVSGCCSVCGQEIPDNAVVSVTLTGTLPEGVSDVDNLICRQNATFTVTVKSGSGLDASVIKEVTKTLSGDHNLGVGGAYQAPSCTMAGRKAYYTCSGCGKNFWDEADAKDGTVITDKDGQEIKGEIAPDSEILKIPQKDHTFKLRGFEWEDKKNNKAKATLRCTGCDGIVEVHNLIATEPTAEEKQEAARKQNAVCGGNVIWNYKVILDFDRTCVKEGENGFTYTPNPESTAKKAHYEGTLPKTVKQPHIFTTVEGSTVTDPAVQLSWADGNNNDVERNPSAHILKAKVTCQKCGSHVTVKENGAPIDGETNMDAGIIIPIITKKLDTTPAVDDKPAKTYAATCQSGGQSTYQVTVTYRDDNGVMQELAENQEMVTKTPKDPDAHNWTELDWKWEQVTVTGADGKKQPVMTTVTKDGKTYSVSDYRIKATRYCQNENCSINKQNPQVFAGRLGSEPGSGVTEDPTTLGDLTPSPGAAMQISTDTVEKTCITSGKTTYTATAFLNGKKVAENPTPAIYNDPPKGHHIVPDWRWEEKKSGDAVTGFTELVVIRSCSECSSKPAGTLDRFTPVEYKVTIGGTQGTYTGGQVGAADGSDAAKCLTVVWNGNVATCTKAGQVEYVATLKVGDQPYRNTRSLVNSALGHDVKMFIDWREATAEEGQTIAERDRWIPYAVKKCRNNCSGEGAITPVETKLTLLSGDDGYQYTPENCTDSGKKEWKASYVLQTGEAWDISQLETNEDGTPKEDESGNPIVKTLTKTEKIDPVKGKHVYGKGTATWDAKPHNKGTDENNFTDFEEVLSVTLSRTCSKCKHVDEHKFDAKVREGDEPTGWDCSAGYTVDFKVSNEDLAEVMDGGKLAEFVEEGTEETPGSGEKLFDGTKSYTVDPAEGKVNHVLKRIAGESSENCEAVVHPTYYECQRCKKTYTTQSALTPYDGPKEGEKLGHLYGEPEFRWIEEGKTAEAVFTCQRSGCPDKENGGHKYRLVATLDDDPYVEMPAKCIGCIERPDLDKNEGKGRKWGLVTVEITKAEGSLKAGQKFESELEIVIPPGDHVFDADHKCKWCGASEQVTVTFKNTVDSDSSTQYYAYGTDGAGIKAKMPATPNRYNYVFQGWKFDSEEDTAARSADAIAGELAEKIAGQEPGTPTRITVVAVYKKMEQQPATITVQNVYRDENGPDVTTSPKEAGNPIIGSEFTVTAQKDADAAYQDYEFSHWELDKVKVSTSESYLMIVQDSIIKLQAVYVKGSEVEKYPTVIMANHSGKQEADGKYKLSFASAMSIPEGYTFVDSGFVYATSMEENAITQEELVVTNEDTKVKKKSLGGDATNILTLSLGTTTDKFGLNVYIRAYLRYSKPGEPIVDIYSDMLTTNYNLASQRKAR